MKKALLAVAMTMLMIMSPVVARGGDVVAIKNVSPEITHSISRVQVYWIYTMRTRFWENGQKITVFYQDFSSDVHETFVRTVLGTNPSAFEQSVNVYRNNGNAGYFRKVDSSSTMEREVSKTAGGVGYLSNDVLIVNKGNGNVEKFIITN